MNPILEALVIAATAILSGLASCVLIAGVWIALQRRHEADTPSFSSLPSVENLEIPADREFIDIENLDRAPLRNVQSPMINAQSSMPRSDSTFPADTDYQITAAKRF